MSAGGPLDEPAAARLLIAAAIIDVFWVWCLSRLLLPAAWPVLTALLPAALDDFAGIVLFGLLLPLFWLVTDVLIGGYSPGRLAAGLSMGNAAGGGLSLPRRMTRCLGKLATIGITGLRLHRLAPYDRIAGTVWHAPLAPVAAGEWRLGFLSGPWAGKGCRLARLAGFDPAVPLRIGRDEAWAQLRIPDPRVSRRHAELVIRDGMPFLRDLGSDHGSTVDGRPVPQGKLVPLGAAREFAIAGNRMVLRR